MNKTSSTSKNLLTAQAPYVFYDVVEAIETFFFKKNTFVTTII